MNQSAIKTQNLTKFYGSVRGIINVDFEVKKGEIFGYLGPNAAGKTTTIRLLMDFIRPSAGRAVIFGYDSRKKSVLIKKKIGYLPSDFRLYEHLTVKEMLLFFAHLRKNVHWPYVEMLGELLKSNFSQKIRTLSQGNKQKIGVIQALMHKPDLLILDEPTNGLDPIMRMEFYKLVNELKAEGKTIFISSHVLPEVEKICDRVGIIREGKIVAIENVPQLLKKRIRYVEIEVSSPLKKIEFSSLKNIDNLIVDGCRIKCRIIGNMDQFIKVVSKYKITNFSSHQPSLEEIFLAYYGESSNVS